MPFPLNSQRGFITELDKIYLKVNMEGKRAKKILKEQN